jgi:hypothetical protein
MAGGKRSVEVDGPDDDTLEIMPLGAGSEVGRSCILASYKGKKVMLDCGVHPGKEVLENNASSAEWNDSPGRKPRLTCQHAPYDVPPPRPRAIHNHNINPSCLRLSAARGIYTRHTPLASTATAATLRANVELPSGWMIIST